MQRPVLGQVYIEIENKLRVLGFKVYRGSSMRTWRNSRITRYEGPDLVAERDGRTVAIAVKSRPITLAELSMYAEFIRQSHNAYQGLIVCMPEHVMVHIPASVREYAEKVGVALSTPAALGDALSQIIS